MSRKPWKNKTTKVDWSDKKAVRRWAAQHMRDVREDAKRQMISKLLLRAFPRATVGDMRRFVKAIQDCGLALCRARKMRNATAS